jgi:hypothetical protein
VLAEIMMELACWIAELLLEAVCELLFRDAGGRRGSP